MNNITTSDGNQSSSNPPTAGIDPNFASLQSVLEDTLDCNLCVFDAGEVIFEEGSLSDKAYIIESGLVEIFVGSNDKEIQLSVMGPGNIFGEMGLIDSQPRSASARALSECHCVVMSAMQIEERIAASPPVVQLLMSILLHRTRAYNSYLENHWAIPKIELPKPPECDQASTNSPKYQRIVESMKLESDLQNAVGSGELVLYYQPLLNLKEGNLVGFEALLRWNSPTRGLVSPNQFIDLAEETSLIVPIGDWILKQAFADLQRFQNAMATLGESDRKLMMSINVAVRQFQEPDFFEKLTTLAEEYEIDPEQIKLEVTERIFMDKVEAIRAISQCRTAGFEVALDDFGTGYSSLNYLERCEIDSLKIDQSFIQKLCTSDRAKVLVGSIIDISQKLGLPTFAEGIETPEQMAVLKELGCEIGQGYLFSRPVAFSKALLLLGKTHSEN
jgi:EAL domain-containing protein (putative c-di-GMP-specific phosphodiesterase class I)/CRP-like cAMP-binding protein